MIILRFLVTEFVAFSFCPLLCWFVLGGDLCGMVDGIVLQYRRERVISW